jgi:hypothetical protein
MIPVNRITILKYFYENEGRNVTESLIRRNADRKSKKFLKSTKEIHQFSKEEVKEVIKDFLGWGLIRKFKMTPYSAKGGITKKTQSYIITKSGKKTYEKILSDVNDPIMSHIFGLHVIFARRYSEFREKF